MLDKEENSLTDLKAEQERLNAIVRHFPHKRLLVVGDLVADQFLYGGITRVSREAPVLILHYEKTETTPGGAGNCAVNIAALDGHADMVGVVGDDEPGNALLKRLARADVDCSAVFQQPGLRTTTKVRILAGQLHSTRQQVLRIDYETEPPLDEVVREQLIQRVRDKAQTADAIIISDYNYGMVDATMAGAIREAAAKRGIPVIVDSRYRLHELANFTSGTPNEDEVEYVVGRKFETTDQLVEACEELRRRLDYAALLVTRGSHGILLVAKENAPVMVPAIGAKEPVDVTGAGDTVMATYALALSSGSDFADAARLANHAGGIVVMKRGTASISRKELLSSVFRWGEVQH
jgi:rfaE bifunctional protein kinase chain/domain